MTPKLTLFGFAVVMLAGPAAWSTPALAQSTPPQLTAGSVLSATQIVGQPASTPVIQFTFTTGSAGISSASFTFTSPDGAVSNGVSYYGGRRDTGGTITFKDSATAPLYSQPGRWVLTSAFISDNQGNYTSYDQAQLAKIFANAAYTLFNDGPVDLTPPVVTAGLVETPSVSLSAPDPQFIARLTGTDNLSGLAVGYVYIKAPKSPFSETSTSYFAFPVAAGSVDAQVPLFAGSPTGTYAISGYELCDLAGNCFTDQNRADIKALFGTATFMVTP